MRVIRLLGLAAVVGLSLSAVRAEDLKSGPEARSAAPSR